ncbi:MAG TPA: thioredoxin family protein, partial [Phycisphaerales bacterium]|nr:thioredoxin family protein [Phycisphaerales bacterium]
IYDEQADAKQQIAAAVAKAKKENRRVLVQWGANWCGWCHKLHETCAKDKDLSRELLYEYDVVLVDIGRFDKNMDLAASYGADLKGNGVPYLTVLDGEGKATANQETSSLEEGDHHLPAKVLSFLKQHQAEYLTAESVLSDGVKKAAAEKKVVFLHFGAPWCGWCHKLENWMAKPEIAQILGKDFVDVKIDIDRTVGGKDLMKRYAGEKAKGIPWFAFVNAADNTVVATSDDSNGANVGFPAKDEEIAHFGAMLGKAHKSITPEDIQTLLKSLKDANKAAQ